MEDAAFWNACAGLIVNVPAAGAAVYYFPEGHAEQATSPLSFSSYPRRKSFYFTYTVDNVKLLADPITDEVFEQIRLVPVHVPLAPSREVQIPLAPPLPPAAAKGGSGVRLFVKVLTHSSVNWSSSGFLVPRECVEQIFPQLDFTAELPRQDLKMRDALGTEWTFQYIYRRKSRSYVLTSGWTDFVRRKGLIAGDSLVFFRNMKRELFVGVRRTARVDGVRSDEYIFTMSERRRAVVEAVEAAMAGRTVEVAYYPKAGIPNFVVGKEDVDWALAVPWQAGLRVMMTVEMEALRENWRNRGTVRGTKASEQCPWGWSPWRMLQVTWDLPDFLPMSVNPWQVEFFSETPEIPRPIAKRLQAQRPDLQDGKQDMHFPASGGDFGSTDPPSIGCSSRFPAGTQGAMQDITGNSSSSMIGPYCMSRVNIEKAAEQVVPRRLDHVSIFFRNTVRFISHFLLSVVWDN